MTQIDFYILPGTSSDERLELVCRLAEKAAKRRQRLFIHTESERMSHLLDEKLWSFRDDSFVPHQVVEKTEAVEGHIEEEHILISHRYEPDGSRSVLINLATDVPYFFSRFDRTLEIINDEGDIKTRGRERWNFYKHRGYPLNHHRLKGL